MTNIHLLGSPDSKGVATEVFLTVMQLSQEVWADLLLRTAVDNGGEWLVHWQIQCSKQASEATIKVMLTRQDKKTRVLSFDSESGTSYGHIGTPRIIIAEVEFLLNDGKAKFAPDTQEWIDGTEKISVEVVRRFLKTYHTIA